MLFWERLLANRRMKSERLQAELEQLQQDELERQEKWNQRRLDLYIQFAAFLQGLSFVSDKARLEQHEITTKVLNEQGFGVDFTKEPPTVWYLDGE